MKHFLLVFLSLIFSLSATLCERWDMEIGQGYQEGSLDWNIAGPVSQHLASPNVLSELKWQDLKMWNSRLYAATYTCGYRTAFEGNYGKICEGYVVDDDYGASHRQSRFCHAHATGNRGEVFDYNLTVGYGLTYLGVTLTPYGGWGYAAQHLKMQSPAVMEYNGNNNPFYTVPIEFKTDVLDLDSNYNASWQGALAGFDLSYDYACFHLFGGFEYHWLNFKAKAHWNLRDDIIGPFHHSGTGYGTKFKVGGAFEFAYHWSIGLLATFTDYRLKDGIEHSKIKTENQIISIKTRLNGVNWHSWTLNINLGYRF